MIQQREQAVILRFVIAPEENEGDGQIYRRKNAPFSGFDGACVALPVVSQD